MFLSCLLFTHSVQLSVPKGCEHSQGQGLRASSVVPRRRLYIASCADNARRRGPPRRMLASDRNLVCRLIPDPLCPDGSALLADSVFLSLSCVTVNPCRGGAHSGAATARGGRCVAHDSVPPDSHPLPVAFPFTPGPSGPELWVSPSFCAAPFRSYPSVNRARVGGRELDCSFTVQANTLLLLFFFPMCSLQPP